MLAGEAGKDRRENRVQQRTEPEKEDDELRDDELGEDQYETKDRPDQRRHGLKVDRCRGRVNRTARSRHPRPNTDSRYASTRERGLFRVACLLESPPQALHRAAIRLGDRFGGDHERRRERRVVCGQPIERTAVSASDAPAETRMSAASVGAKSTRFALSSSAASLAACARASSSARRGCGW